MNHEPPPGLRSVYRSTEGQQAVQTTGAPSGWTAGPLPHRRDHISTSAGSTHLVLTGTGSPTVVVAPNANAALYESLAPVLAPRWPTLLLDLPDQPGLKGPPEQVADAVRTSPALGAAVARTAGQVAPQLLPKVPSSFLTGIQNAFWGMCLVSVVAAIVSALKVPKDPGQDIDGASGGL